MSGASFRPFATAVAVVAVLSSAAHAQPQVETLARELAALREEVRALRAEVDALRQASPTPSQPAAQPVPAAPAEPSGALDVIQSQLAELAQTKVESTSRMRVRLFGALHTHAFSNSGTANWLESPNVAGPAPAEGGAGTFGMTLRQTRVGLAVDGATIGGFRTGGVLAVDFFGGIPGFQTGQVMGLPRLLVGYARLERGGTALQVGQDHVLLAPRDPTSLANAAFPALFRSGNLYLRAPQFRAERQLAPLVRLAGALVTPVGGDLAGEEYRFVPPALGGERSRRPALQARLAIGREEPDATRVAVAGLSGHYAWERQGSALRESWAGALDFALRSGRIGTAGELFVGDNADAFGGAAGLNRRAGGGWMELQYFPSARTTIAAGVGLDEIRPGARELLPRRRNRSAFGTLQFSFTPELTGSLEYRWLGTTPGIGAERTNHHVDWVLVYRF